MREKSTTDFGFEEIPATEKQGRVGAVFSSVAQKYDLMNDVMSMGVHHLWKRFTLEMCGLRPGHKVLDIAGGTGDLALKQAQMVGENGHVILADINADMLYRGRDRLIDSGFVNQIEVVQCNAGSFQLLQHDGDFPAFRCGCGVEFDGHDTLLSRFVVR